MRLAVGSCKYRFAAGSGETSLGDRWQCEYGTGLVYATVAVAAEASLVHLYHAWLGTWKDDKDTRCPLCSIVPLGTTQIPSISEGCVSMLSGVVSAQLLAPNLPCMR